MFPAATLKTTDAAVDTASAAAISVSSVVVLSTVGDTCVGVARGVGAVCQSRLLQSVEHSHTAVVNDMIALAVATSVSCLAVLSTVGEHGRHFVLVSVGW